MVKAKSFDISKRAVWDAYRKVNGGASGVDQQSLEDFDQDLSNNLYKLWNRLCSGSYFPPPVLQVEIPKAQGGTRTLGIPTVADRIAQMVIKQAFEPNVEPYLHEDSYGYRSGKSALQAVGVTRQRCWQHDYLVEFDIKGMFDAIDHSLLLRAVDKRTDCRWVRLYIERWLTAPFQQADGELIERDSGTPQGGVVTPRTQKITSALTVRWLTTEAEINLRMRHKRLYLNGIWGDLRIQYEPNASIPLWGCCSNPTALQRPPERWSRPAECPSDKPIAICTRRNLSNNQCRFQSGRSRSRSSCRPLSWQKCISRRDNKSSLSAG